MPGHSVADIAVEYQQFMEEVVEPRLARVPGVSRVNLEGGRPREVRVTVDPHRLAAPGITPQRLAQAVVAARDVSAGFADVGRRQFTVRVTGREPVADLGDLVVGWSDDRPLYLRDTRVTLYGPAISPEDGLEQVIGGQMSYRYFPVRQVELAARITYIDLREGEYDLGDGIRLRAA